MTAPQKPDICIYHNPCSDGFTAAWAVWLKWPDIEFHPGSYNDKTLPDVAGKHVLLVDFSYKSDVLRQMAAEAASITILDHHVSAQEDLAPLLADGTVQGEFDMSRSGAMMAWEYCWPAGKGDGVEMPRPPIDIGDEPVPYLVQYVQDRDLWTWALDDSKEVSAYLQLTPMDFKSWSRVAEELEDCTGYENAVRIGTALVKKQDSEIAGALKSTRTRITILGYDVPIANVPYIWASEAGNILSRGEPFAATYFIAADGSRSFSLRSDKDDPNAVDVSKIAVTFGGGGHKNAAGFRADSDTNLNQGQ